MPVANDDDETVGYKKPPKRTRFKKGQSGNPRGRPKKRMSIGEAYAKVLTKTVEVQEDGQRKRISVVEALVSQQVSRAFKGDRRAIEYLLKQLPVLETDIEEAEVAAIPLPDLDKLSDAELNDLYRKKVQKL